MLPPYFLYIFLGITLVAVGIFARGITHTLAILLAGKPQPWRWHPVGKRLKYTAKHALTHLRFAEGKPTVTIAHWFVMLSFPLLFGTIVTAYGQLVDANWTLPLIGNFAPYTWALEIFATSGIIAIIYLASRRFNTPSRQKNSRLFGSNQAYAYFVEFVIFSILVLIILLRAAEYAHLQPATRNPLLFPISHFLASPLQGFTKDTLALIITVGAGAKIIISLLWLTVVGLTPSMGIAWHRFFAFFTIYLQQEPTPGASLGSIPPLMVENKPFTLDSIENLPEDASIGAVKASDLTRKNLLDIATCTECGRCQDVCPAWNSGSQLSPKLLLTEIREEIFAPKPDVKGNALKGNLLKPEASKGKASKASALKAKALKPDAPKGKARTLENIELVTDDGARSLTALWDCTMCGACTQVCPAQIEHLDIIASLRRGATLMNAAFPKELTRTYKQLETKANPWGKPARARIDWIKHSPVPIPVLGKDVAHLHEVDCLLWVGCAGAFDERANRTLRAVAQLLTIAGVKFCVLGDQENCTGDIARRSGNEILYQEIAQANMQTLDENGANQNTLILTSCAHCFNTFAREYPQIGGTYQVMHHTQFLNKLVNDGRLKPVPPKPGTQTSVDQDSPITYHDPCYLGRHNSEYEAPRLVLKVATSQKLVEMKLSQACARCCGAGGAHAFFESATSSTVPKKRAADVRETGANLVATACPFCATMLENDLKNEANPVEVKDVALILLEAVERGISQ